MRKTKNYEAVLKVLSEGSTQSEEFMSYILSKLPINADLPVLDGGAAWVNLAEGGGWRLQQNKVLKNVRIIDSDNIRRVFSIQPNRLLNIMDELAAEISTRNDEEEISAREVDPDAELARIEYLKQLFDNGAITQEEYQKKKEEMLKRI